MTPKTRISPESRPVRYVYSDPAGRYWPGIPGPGATLTEEEYNALPDYARETFSRAPGVIAPPDSPAPPAVEDNV